MENKPTQPTTVITNPDPTFNVMQLVTEAVSKVDAVMSLHIRRLDDLALERTKRLENEQALRAEYHDKLMIAEAKRIDAVRATDIAAATSANERAIQQADILARQVAQTADVLRALVDSTAKQMATQHETSTRLISERVTLLEKNQYEAQGKSVATSPMTDELVKEMRASREFRNLGIGSHEGMSSVWGYIIASIAAASAIVTIFHILFARGG